MIKTALIYFIFDYCIEKLSNQLQRNLKILPLNHNIHNPSKIVKDAYYNVILVSVPKQDFIGGVVKPDRIVDIYYDCEVYNIVNGVVAFGYEYNIRSIEFDNYDEYGIALSALNDDPLISISSYDDELLAIALDAVSLDGTAYVGESSILGAYNL